MSLEHTCNAIRSRVLHGTDEGGFIDAVACCDWERALNCADQFHFANFTEIMRWRIVTLPRLPQPKQDIQRIYREMSEHPDYCGGTFWTKEDLAAAIYDLDIMDDEPPTPDQVASITETEREAAIKATENYVFRSYSWAEAMSDCGVFDAREAK